MSKNELKKLLDVLDQFDHAMLVTERDDELRSRPMSIADHSDDGRIRFISRDDSGKLDELDETSRVNVSLQGDGRYLSISGRARLTKDQSLIDRCWETHQEQWFETGRDDPHVIVLEVIPMYAEYWDRSVSTLERFIPDQLRDTTRPDLTEEHDKLDFSDKPL